MYTIELKEFSIIENSRVNKIDVQKYQINIDFENDFQLSIFSQVKIFKGELVDVYDQPYPNDLGNIIQDIVDQILTNLSVDNYGELKLQFSNNFNIIIRNESNYESIILRRHNKEIAIV